MKLAQLEAQPGIPRRQTPTHFNAGACASVERGSAARHTFENSQRLPRTPVLRPGGTAQAPYLEFVTRGTMRSLPFFSYSSYEFCQKVR